MRRGNRKPGRAAIAAARRAFAPDRQRPAFGRIAAAALASASSLVAAWLPQGRREGREWVALNPRRSDASLGSFRVNLSTGRWADFACGASGGDLISLSAYLRGLSQADAARALAAELGVAQ